MPDAGTKDIASCARPRAELTASALATSKHAASMANPTFYELQRLRKSTWDAPRFVRGYDVTLDGDLVLPRALWPLVAEIRAINAVLAHDGGVLVAPPGRARP